MIMCIVMHVSMYKGENVEKALDNILHIFFYDLNILDLCGTLFCSVNGPTKMLKLL